MALKKIYIALIILYALVFGIYFFSFDISYKIVGAYPAGIVNRDLTHEERKALSQAEIIRKDIYQYMMISSVIMCLSSALIIYFKLYSPIYIPKIILVLSGYWALLLIIVSGIHFIPGPPIR